MKTERNQPSQQSLKFQRQRKFLLALPILVLPFLTFLLWAVGLVGEVKAENKLATIHQGLNLSLPSAAPAKDSTWNKMKYYEQADRDSLRLRSLLKNDPYRKLELDILSTGTGTDTSLEPLESKDKQSRRASFDPYPAGKQQDYNEKRVQQKLAVLQEQLDIADKEEQKVKRVRETRQRSTSELTAINPDVAKLEAMMQSMQEGTGENAELKQLNTMLDKIMLIQNPQSMEDKIREQSEMNKRQVYPVHTRQDDIVTLLEAKRNWQEMPGNQLPDTTARQVQERFEFNRFFSLDEETSGEERTNAIAAVVHEEQTLVSGATVKFRLLEDVFIGGVPVAKDQFVFGTATLSGERLLVSIQSIRSESNILPVALSVYDMDGLSGIYIPGAITQGVAKRSASQSAQQLGAINSLDPSLGAQMATAGIQAAQSLISKAAKLVKVTVKTGYSVLLIDDNKKDK